MKALFVSLPASPKKPNALAAMIAVFALGCTTLAPSSAQAMDEAAALTPIAQAAQELRADYRLLQWKRLAQKSDRDSLIAAVLLGMANDENPAPIEGHAEVGRRLAEGFGNDPLVLFTLALACQRQADACANRRHYDELVRIDPDNAVNWLLLPNDANPGDAQLHAAAVAGEADTHLRDMLGFVRAALADQPAPATRPDIDPRELALLLRRGAADQVPMPQFRGAIEVCKGAVAQRRDDCIGLGRRLQADRSGSIVSIMVGNVLLRRLMKGSPEDSAAKQSRAQYVWMGEQLEASTAPYQEQLQDEVVAFGEWEAVQRSVERIGTARTPSSSWVPKDPQTLLMSEERTPAAAK